MRKISTSDRLEILELFARYSWAIDTGDADSYASVFVENGTMQGGVRKFQGTEELKRFVSLIWKSDSHTQHWTTNHIFTPNDFGCSAVSYLVEFKAQSADRSEVAIVGYYKDELTKTENGWRFVHRNFTAWTQYQK